MKVGDESICVSWNSTTLRWSKEGCLLIVNESNENFSVCECNHSNGFAAILDMKFRKDISWIDEMIDGSIHNISNVVTNLEMIKKITRKETSIKNFEELKKLVNYLINLQDFVHSEEKRVVDNIAWDISYDLVIIFNNLIDQSFAWIEGAAEAKKIASKILLYVPYSSFILRFNNHYIVERELKNIYLRAYSLSDNERIVFAFNESSIEIPEAISFNQNLLLESKRFGIGYFIKGLGNYLVNKSCIEQEINSEVIAFSFNYTNQTQKINNNLRVRIR
jgi:hypothetical protein